ncbi:hypothetical protein ACSBR2_003636 [Camellia fascicularis]
MKDPLPFCFLVLLLLISPCVATYDGPLYDNSAYTECKTVAESPLYKGGIIKGQALSIAHGLNISGSVVHFPAFVLHNLTANCKYCFSSWVKISGANSTLIKASLTTDNTTYQCVGTVIAKHGCWSFLKGGFVLDSPSHLALLFFQNPDGRDINITIASASLQPFTDEQWRANQQYKINTERKRAVMLHVLDVNGNGLPGAEIEVMQVSKDFLFGSAIAKTILGNLPYQNWFVERFNAAVFEDELKWYSTEPQQGHVNYTIPDEML